MSTTPSAHRPSIAFNHHPIPSTPPLAGMFGRARSRPTSLEFFVKRLIDFVGAGVGVVVISPVLMILAVLIRLESRGPIFFRQERMGRDGRPFRIWKFRTMVVDAEERLKELEHLNESDGGVLFKLKKDPRLTRLGPFLRRTSLDELPQLFNVVLGQMSLVGPRPLPLRDCSLLKERDGAAFNRRLKVLPGVTGLWQVSGRSLIGVDQMIHLDCHYVESWSLALDVWIILKTVGVLFGGKGAF
jgi:lipopolysaccharide/colanic/teichoic acid biosynthesis glycosyltransferase